MKDYHDLKFHRLPIPIYPLVIYFVLSKKKKKYLIKDRTEESKNLFTFVTFKSPHTSMKQESYIC